MYKCIQDTMPTIPTLCIHLKDSYRETGKHVFSTRVKTLRVIVRKSPQSKFELHCIKKLNRTNKIL